MLHGPETHLMTTSSPTALALDGAAIDGGLYTDVTDFARHTHWLNEPATVFSSIGIGLFVVYLLVAWWRARGQGSTAMAAVLATPIAVVLSYVVNSGIKDVFDEPRPCRAPHDFLLEACPRPTTTPSPATTPPSPSPSRWRCC